VSQDQIRDAAIEGDANIPCCVPVFAKAEASCEASPQKHRVGPTRPRATAPRRGGRLRARVKRLAATLTNADGYRPPVGVQHQVQLAVADARHTSADSVQERCTAAVHCNGSAMRRERVTVPWVRRDKHELLGLRAKRVHDDTPA